MLQFIKNLKMFEDGESTEANATDDTQGKATDDNSKEASKDDESSKNDKASKSSKAFKSFESEEDYNAHIESLQADTKAKEETLASRVEAIEARELTMSLKELGVHKDAIADAVVLAKGLSGKELDKFIKDRPYLIAKQESSEDKKDDLKSKKGKKQSVSKVGPELSGRAKLLAEKGLL